MWIAIICIIRINNGSDATLKGAMECCTMFIVV